jgi:TPR repeat protein
MYAHGIGVEKAARTGFDWYVQAAYQGDRFSMWALGNMLRYGEGIERRDVRAVHWFRLAAEANLRVAMASLGDMYLTGRGVAKSLSEAEAWYKKANMQSANAAEREEREKTAFLTENRLNELTGLRDHSVRHPKKNTRKKASKKQAERVPA